MNIIDLHYGNWDAKIAVDYGFNVYSLTCRGDDVLRTTADPETDLAASPVVYGTPLLFPPDRLTNNGFSFEGKQYTMRNPDPAKPYKIHGSMHSAPMRVVYRSASMAVGEYEDAGVRYPFPFRMSISCELGGEGLRQRFCIMNTGSGNMPLVFGLHTTFLARPIVSVSVGKAWVTGENFDAVEEKPLSDEDRKLVSGRNTEGIILHDIYTDSGFHTATVGEYCYRLSRNFKNWVVWNKDGTRGFISLQPQSAPVNSLNKPGRYIILAPGAEEVFETLITRA